MDASLPTPTAGAETAWVAEHLADLVIGPIAASPSIRGGQTAADRAVEAFDVTGYANRRNEVYPRSRRGASRLSPYIRYGLVSLQHMWKAVAGGPHADVAKFRDELLWQEYARHLYARTDGASTSLRHYVPERTTAPAADWVGEMACLKLVLDELTDDGWLVNQTRMWFASHWSVRMGLGWRDGEDLFFTHLLDGSRAANRLGWQWTVGAGTGRPYGFAHGQVEKRAPGVCGGCPLRQQCPIQSYPAESDLPSVDPVAGLRSDPSPEATAGPSVTQVFSTPDAVWLTAESLGDDDPALAAHPELPAVFIFDEALLARLHLSAKRLIFIAECLADLAERREVQVWRGDPTSVLASANIATTFAPVPGWKRRSAIIAPVEIHPWPWLVRPQGGSATSFTAWRKSSGR